jgi:endonuclease-3
MLVATILSQNTNDSNSSAGFEKLRRHLPTWDAVADAPLGLVRRCIRVSGLAGTKAPRIQAILREIRRRRGRIELDFLADMDADEAFDTLTAFKGVGPKTALCTLLFALGRPVFPVDTHIFRIARRLGVLAENVPPARAHEVLTPLIAPRDRYATHVLLIAHGRAVCKARIPLCRQCRILHLCQHGQQRLEHDWCDDGAK